MKKPLCIFFAIVGCIVSGILLGEYYETQKLGDPEYYLLFFSIVVALKSTGLWWMTFHKRQ